MPAQVLLCAGGALKNFAWHAVVVVWLAQPWLSVGLCGGRRAPDAPQRFGPVNRIKIDLSMVGRAGSAHEVPGS
jgi:hypothetical protein